MKINMQNKSIIPATMAVLVVLGAFAPGFSSVASAASFGSGPFDVIEGYNYSDQGSGKYWQEDSANASVGEVVTVKVFIKNTSDEVAEDVNVKLSTSESGDTGTITATISADNAGSISDNFKVYLDGAGATAAVVDALALIESVTDGDVIGPGSSTNNNFTAFDGIFTDFLFSFLEAKFYFSDSIVIFIYGFLDEYFLLL